MTLLTKGPSKVTHITRDVSYNIIFLDNSGSLKLYAPGRNTLQQLSARDPPGPVRETKIAFKLNPAKNRLLFLVNETRLEEFTLGGDGAQYVTTYADDKFRIEDFAYSKELDRKGEEYQILMISQSGILKKINKGQGDQAKRFEIDKGRQRIYV